MYLSGFLASFPRHFCDPEFEVFAFANLASTRLWLVDRVRDEWQSDRHRGRRWTSRVRTVRIARWTCEPWADETPQRRGKLRYNLENSKVKPWSRLVGFEGEDEWPEQPDVGLQVETNRREEGSRSYAALILLIQRIPLSDGSMLIPAGSLPLRMLRLTSSVNRSHYLQIAGILNTYMAAFTL